MAQMGFFDLTDRYASLDARWTKKHGKNHYGYKNHVNVERKHKLVRRYHVSDAARGVTARRWIIC